MKIVIVGAGVVGSTLAEELSTAGNTVSVVEQNTQLVRQLNDRMDVLAVCGNACAPSTLRSAGVDDAEMIIAVTDIDEVNIVACMLANKFGVKHKVARIRNEEYAGPNAMFQPAELGIDTVINPENILAADILRVLDVPGSRDVVHFAEGKIALVTFDVDKGAAMDGKRLREVRAQEDLKNFLVTAIIRDERPIVPRGDDEIRAGDHIVVMAPPDQLERLVPLVQVNVHPTERVVIYGGTLVAESLARTLLSRGQKVVIIEPNEATAQRLAIDLPDALVLRGEASDPLILAEADLQAADYFIALSKDDQANLLAALIARRNNAQEVAVMAQNPDFLPILNSIGMDVVLNPRIATVGEVLRYIRRGQVHMVTRLKESEAEVIELEAATGAKITKQPLKLTSLPPGSLVGAIIRGDEMVIPDGNTRISAGETVLVFALPTAIPKIEKLFSKPGLFS